MMAIYRNWRKQQAASFLFVLLVMIQIRCITSWIIIMRGDSSYPQAPSKPVLETGDRRSNRWVQQSSTRRDALGAVIGASWVLTGGRGHAQAAATTARSPSPRITIATSPLACNDAISHLRDPSSGKEIFLVGTAHISNASAQLVRTTIQEIKPQTVMIELDEGRINRVQAPPPPSSAPATAGGSATTPRPALPQQNKQGFLGMVMKELTRPGTGLRERFVNVGAVVVGQVISGLYKTLDKMGFVSGQEFIVAIEESQKIGANLLLGDRDVKVTLRRLSEALSQSDLVKVREIESPTRSPAARELKARGIAVGNDPKDISAAVEALKDRQSVRALIGTLKQELPQVYAAMIQERDEYMANNLRACPSKRIVAVVGMGHMDGIERYLGYNIVPCRLKQ